MYRRGGVSNARVSLVATFNNASSEHCHTGTLDWHLDVKPYFREIEIIKETTWKVKDCNFFGKAATTDVFNRDHDWATPDAHAPLNWMASLRFADEDRVIEIKFSFPDAGKRDQLKEIIYSLGKAGHMPFNPFRSEKTGIPLVQYGMIRPVDELAKCKYNNSDQEYDFAMYTAKNTFSNINEYVIQHACGEYQEWTYQRSVFENWRDGKHDCSFVALQGDIMLVKVKVNGVKLDKLPLTNNVTLQIMFTPEGISHVEGMQKVKAAIKEDVLHLAGPDEIALLVVNKTAEHFRGMCSVFPKQDGPTFTCTISAELDDSHIKWQLHASSEMTSKRTIWNQLFVNEDACIEPFNDPSEAFKEFSDVEKAMIFMEECKKAQLSESQMAAAGVACFRNVAGAAAIKAAAGTGKTRVSSVVVNYFLRIGTHVIGIATSNSAVDASYTGIETLQATPLPVDNEDQDHNQNAEEQHAVPEDPTNVSSGHDAFLEESPIRFYAWANEVSDLKHAGPRILLGCCARKGRIAKMSYIGEYTRKMISDDRVAVARVTPTAEEVAEHKKRTVRAKN
ncbi:hypothetical protein LTR84_007684 [Exophiala bonariae]|uniref:DNA2/NAM7 helicase helicase domain-containing protein n=1 Tax=Exophiala bonariae TaxID=1690606 RepID=A0AAV9NN91_9EURO|nr:hypothetical protein LTR84_007684 [Exophiala bonariae]